MFFLFFAGVTQLKVRLLGAARSVLGGKGDCLWMVGF